MAQDHARKIVARPRGRPTSKESIKIDKQIRNYFIKGASASYVILKTKLDKNTVYSRYRELADTVKQSMEKDFLERYEQEREQIIITFDQDIADVEEFLAQIREVKKSVDPDKPFFAFLIKQEFDLMKFKFSIKDKKAGYAIKPTPREAFKQKSEILENGAR